MESMIRIHVPLRFKCHQRFGLSNGISSSNNGNPGTPIVYFKSQQACQQYWVCLSLPIEKVRIYFHRNESIAQNHITALMFHSEDLM